MSAENENNANPNSVAEIVADFRKAALLGLPIDPDAVADQIEKAFGRLEDWWHSAVGKGGMYYTPPEILEIAKKHSQIQKEEV